MRGGEGSIMSRFLKSMVLGLLLVILLLACQGAFDNQDVSIPGNNLADPTKTPTATNVLRATPTAEPTYTPAVTQSATPNDVPPVIRLAVPTNAFVGKEIEIDASGTFDFDQDPINFSWSQLHMPNEYRGTEYASGTELKFQVDASSESLKLTPQWPAVYQIEVSASDVDGVSTEVVTIPVNLQTDPFTYEGFALDWCCDTSRINAENLDTLLSDAQSMGANTIEIAPIGCMPDPKSTQILSYPGAAPSPYTCVGNVSDELLAQMIEEAHARDLIVLLAPQIQGFSDTGFFWTGSIQPSSWSEWFVNYEKFIVHYAELADKHHVELLQVGNELNSSQRFTSEWAGIVDQIRAEYSGKIGLGITLTWHAGWPSVNFWDELDFIGFHFYLEGTGNQWPVHPSVGFPASNDPTVQELRSNFERTLTYALDPLVEESGLEVIVTELGTSNYDGANITHFGEESMTLDNKEQADYYEAALQTLSTRDYVAGVISWALDWENPSHLEIGLDPRGKPAQGVLITWFGGNAAP